MDVTDSDVAGIPRGNVRVPIEEFVAVWREAARRDSALSVRGLRTEEIDWYDAAVAITCRWMATAPARGLGPWTMPRGPASNCAGVAYEELIQAEYLASLDVEHRRPSIARRPGWGPAVRATLRWAWRREGPPPLEGPVAPAS